MGTEEEYSRIVRLGGSSHALNAYVATVAALRLVDVMQVKRDVFKEFTSHFLRWLDQSTDPAECELRRGVLLNLVDSLVAHGGAEREAAEIVKVAEELYISI